MTETTDAYREVLDGLARSRGLSGAGELVERAAKLSPRHTGRRFTKKELLAGARSGFGDALDGVLGMDESECGLLSRTWWDTFITPLSQKLPASS